MSPLAIYVFIQTCTHVIMADMAPTPKHTFTERDAAGKLYDAQILNSNNAAGPDLPKILTLSLLAVVSTVLFTPFTKPSISLATSKSHSLKRAASLDTRLARAPFLSFLCGARCTVSWASTSCVSWRVGWRRLYSRQRRNACLVSSSERV